jgi:hypothetical protein
MTACSANVLDAFCCSPRQLRPCGFTNGACVCGLAVMLVAARIGIGPNAERAPSPRGGGSVPGFRALRLLKV